MARNCDDHTKNFAFRLKKDSQWELAPAYDICHAYRPDHQWVSQHTLSVNGKRRGITKTDLSVIGRLIKCKHAEDIIEEVEATVSTWKRFADKVGVSSKLRDAIHATLLDCN